MKPELITPAFLLKVNIVQILYMVDVLHNHSIYFY